MDSDRTLSDVQPCASPQTANATALPLDGARLPNRHGTTHSDGLIVLEVMHLGRDLAMLPSVRLHLLLSVIVTELGWRLSLHSREVRP